MRGLTTMAGLPNPTRCPPMPECEAPRQDEQREIRFLGDLQRLQPKPGDVFVLQVPGRISNDMADAIRQQWRHIMGDVQLLVLDSDTKLGCIGAGSGD